MKRIAKVLILVLIIIIFLGCQKTEPVITDEDEEVIEELPEEEIGVIEQITEEETAPEEGEEVEGEQPEKPDIDELEKGNIVIVEMDDLKFVPKETNISAGTTVVWKHKDEYAGSSYIVHVLTFYPPEGAGFTSTRMTLGDSFNYTFTESGRYRYISVPYKNRMQGYINVE